MLSISEGFHWFISFFARSREGLTPDEARDLFFKFRQKKVLKPGEPESPSEQEPAPSSVPPISSPQLNSFMRETTAKLDRIEKDIEYLKEQVDKILKKI